MGVRRDFMLRREEIEEILNQARSIDPDCVMFGASAHQYRLNPPIEKSFVEKIEKQYGFQLPEDYFRFITQIGDGGAGPDYGIQPFSSFLRKDCSLWVEKCRKAYRHSLAKPFTPRPMRADELEEYAIATREQYEKEPDRYFVYENFDPDDWSETNGYFNLGTHGCQWDYGIITAGEKFGQVFDIDNECAYYLLANSFDEFYQDWLAQLANTACFREKLESWKRLIERK